MKKLMSFFAGMALATPALIAQDDPESFRLATRNRRIKAAFPFYGSGPGGAEDIARNE